VVRSGQDARFAPGPHFVRSAPSGSIVRVASDYRFSTPLLIRSMGALLALLGVLVLVVGLLVGVLDLPRALLTVAVVLAVLVVVGTGFLLTRVTSLVHFDDAGYRVRWLRGAGVKQARWREVEDVVTASVAGHDCVVLRLRDGRTTTIPVRVLDAAPAAFIEDLSARLDTGYGYRRLR
jgi:hypothetical protein